MSDVNEMHPDAAKLEGMRHTAQYNFKLAEDYFFKSERGLTKRVVEQISYYKGEPQWMLDFRLRAFDIAEKKGRPKWGPNLDDLNFDEIFFYVRPNEKQQTAGSWDEIPEEVRRTYERLGVPQAEQRALAGVGAQYESRPGAGPWSTATTPSRASPGARPKATEEARRPRWRPSSTSAGGRSCCAPCSGPRTSRWKSRASARARRASSK